MWQTLTEDALTSKKFLVWLATFIVVIGNHVLAKLAPGMEMDPSAVYAFVASASAYTVGQGIADHGKPATEKQVQLGAVQAMSSGPEKDDALKTLAGVSPGSITSADQIPPKAA